MARDNAYGRSGPFQGSFYGPDYDRSSGSHTPYDENEFGRHDMDDRHWGAKARLGKGYPQQERHDREIFRGSYGAYGNHGQDRGTERTYSAGRDEAAYRPYNGYGAERGSWRDRDRDGYEGEFSWHDNRGAGRGDRHGDMRHPYQDPHPYEFNSDWEQADRLRRENSADWGQDRSRADRSYDRYNPEGGRVGSGRSRDPHYSGGYDPYDGPHRGANYRDGDDY